MTWIPNGQNPSWMLGSAKPPAVSNSSNVPRNGSPWKASTLHPAKSVE